MVQLDLLTAVCEPKKRTFPWPPDWAVHCGIFRAPTSMTTAQRRPVLSSAQQRVSAARRLAWRRLARLMARACPADVLDRFAQIALRRSPSFAAHRARRLARCGGGSARRSRCRRRRSPPGEKLYCVSYAPFRGAQNPLVEGTRVSPSRSTRIWRCLPRYTDCVRTYSVEDGLDQVLGDRPAPRAEGDAGHLARPAIRKRPAGRSRPSVALAKEYPGRHHRASSSATRCCCAAR